MKSLPLLAAVIMIFAQFALVGAEDTSNTSGAVVMGDNEPSINPDSIFWGFKDAFDKFSLTLTFNSESKAKKSIIIAEERLREFEKMAKEGNIEAAKKAKESHKDFIERAKSAAKDISESNKTEEIEKQIKIESEVEKLENRTEIITERLKIKIKTEGNLTAEQQALIDSLIASMQNQTGSLKIEIKQNKEKIKIEIKQRTNKTEEEIEDEIEEIENKHNLTGGKLDEAFEKLIDAREEVAKLKEEVSAGNITDSAVLALLENAEKALSEAEKSMNESRFDDVYGLSNAAKELAENGREKIEKLAEKEDKEKGENKTPHNETEDDEGKGRVCIQVITPAKNEKTGECKDFSTPCDVPKGWEKVKGCTNSGSSNTTSGENETG